MQSGQSGKVVEIQGGHGLINRLNALGVRPGKRITKVSSMLMRGPITLQSGNTRIAVGFGMANKIIVELD
jgi:ferrous iron transport protein A